jgi:hypothetical protein
MPHAAAIFLHGQRRAASRLKLSPALTSQKIVPAARIMWRPEIETMW